MLALAGVVIATSATAVAGAASEPERIRLSNERTLSRWAYVVRKAPARTRPRPRARVLKKLSTATEDRTPELVLALQELRTTDHGTWVKARLPMRPNGTKGWIRRNRLGRYHEVRTQLRINRDRMVAKLYRRGKRIWRAPVGIGEPQWPTPGGRFYARERLKPTDKDGIYGVFAIGTSAYSEQLTDWPGGGIVGIHGTNQPQLIPGRISHGCVRVRNPKMRRLKRKMPLGTPIRIR